MDDLLIIPLTVVGLSFLSTAPVVTLRRVLKDLIIDAFARDTNHSRVLLFCRSIFVVCCVVG